MTHDDSREPSRAAMLDGELLERLEDLAAGRLEPDAAAELEARLSADPEAASLFETVRDNQGVASSLRSAGAGLGGGPGTAVGAPPPQVPGYDVGDELHRGGQGIVYAGVQRSTGRDVAIKVLLRGELATERQAARFEREIDLLASLEHPGIVTVFDRATTTDGRAALVMERVRGEPIDAFLRRENAGLRRMLGLFADLADVVAAAHRRGVIHRDLKPANVLVDGAGRPRVLDFGLAKSSADRAGGVATRDHEFLGTLAYAAPEQFSAGSAAADVRSDVYSLGAMLYEAVTGRPPVDVSGPIGVALSRVARETPPPPLGARRGERMPRDAETVLMTALAKDPARRYGGAGAFADDLRRCLDHQPIAARTPSAAYLLSRFARRNPALVVAGVLAVATLAASTAVVGVALVRTTAARRAESAALVRATTEADKQARIGAFLRRVFTSVDPGRSGRDMRVIELLEDAASEIPAEFEGYPVLQGALFTTVAETAWRLGDLDDALGLAERASAMLGPIDSDEARLEHARCLALLGGIHLSSQRFDEAKHALDRGAALLADGGDGASLLAAKIRTNLAAVDLQAGEPEVAEDRLAAVLGDLAGDDRPEASRLRLQAMVSQGVAIGRQGRQAEALSLYDEAVPLLERERGPTHPDTLACRTNRAGALWDVGRRDEALAEMSALVDLRRETFGPDHERVGVAVNNLADSLRQLERFDEAAGLYAEALRIYRGVHGERNMRVATVTHNAGVMELDRGLPGRALPLLDDAAATARELLPAGHWIAAQFDLRRGEAMVGAGEGPAGCAVLVEACRRLAAALGPDHPRVVKARETLTAAGCDRGGGNRPGAAAGADLGGHP